MTLPAPCLATLVEGVVVVEQGPLEGAVVSAYGSLKDIRQGTPLYRSSAGEKPGFYRLDLPPGAYHLVATGRQAGVEYFSFHGANPVTIANEKLWLPFVATPKTPVAMKKSDTPQLAGVVTYKGKPVADALVSLYSAVGEQYKGLGLVTKSTDGEGNSHNTVEATMSCRSKRWFPTDDAVGKVSFCLYAGSPVTIATGWRYGSPTAIPRTM